MSQSRVSKRHPRWLPQRGTGMSKCSGVMVPAAFFVGSGSPTTTLYTLQRDGDRSQVKIDACIITAALDKPWRQRTGSEIRTMTNVRMATQNIFRAWWKEGGWSHLNDDGLFRFVPSTTPPSTLTDETSSDNKKATSEPPCGSSPSGEMPSLESQVKQQAKRQGSGTFLTQFHGLLCRSKVQTHTERSGT